MSDFAKLKAQRKAKEHKPYASATASSKADADHGTPTMQKDVFEKPPNEQGGPNRTQAEGLYPALPADLVIQVEGERGRGLFSRYSRRPGKNRFSLRATNQRVDHDLKRRRYSSINQATRCYTFERPARKPLLQLFWCWYLAPSMYWLQDPPVLRFSAWSTLYCLEDI